MTNLLYDFNAERAVLGAILLDADLALGWLTEHHFTPEAFKKPEHSVMYRTMAYMHSHGIPVDPSTLNDRLEKKGNTNKAGGRDYVNKTLDAIPTIAHLEHYGDIVMEMHRLRNLNDCLLTVPAMVQEGRHSSEIVAQTIASIVSNIDMKQGCDPEKLHAQSLSAFEQAKLGFRSGLPSFLEPLNNIIGSYIETSMYILAGRPSDGKSTLAHNEVIHKAVGMGVPCAFASLEMGERLLREMMAGAIADVSAFAFRNGLYTDAQYNRLREAYAVLGKAPLYINDSRMTIDESIAWITYMVRRHKVKFVVYDYLQLTKPSKWSRSGMSRNERVAEWSAQLKGLAKQLNIVLMVISQLSRAGIRNQDQTPPPPTLEALRDSGGIEQDADCVFMLYKKPNMPVADFYSDRDWAMELDVMKSRIGPIGTKRLVYVRRRQRFETEIDYELRKKNDADPSWTRALIKGEKK